MNRAELAHVLRSAARIVEDGDILVVGSQAILGTADEPHLPAEATMSVEADLAFFNDPDEQKALDVDGAIGEGSKFHEEFGYYAQGVSIDTAELPAGWRGRVVPFSRPDAEPAEAVCLDGHDLVVAKLVANREKDREFAVALIAAELIKVETLLVRIEALGVPGAVKDRVRQTVARCAADAGCG